MLGDCYDYTVQLNPIILNNELSELMQTIQNGSTAIVDVQGFVINGKFTPKELSYTINDNNICTYLFKPICSIDEVTNPNERRQIRWIEKNHHCINFENGTTPLSTLDYIFPHNVCRCIVKGQQKEEFLKEQFPQLNIINLENFPSCSMVMREKQLHNCNNHMSYISVCSKYNVCELHKFMKTQV